MFAARWRLGREEGKDALDVRRRVFVEERGIPEAEEFDWADDFAAHVFVCEQESGAPIAAGRMYPENGDTRIGRIAVLPQWRKEPYDELVLRMMLDKAQRLDGARVLIDADEGERALCKPFGFLPTGEEKDARGAHRVTLAVPRDGIVWDSKCKHA